MAIIDVEVDSFICDSERLCVSCPLSARGKIL